MSLSNNDFRKLVSQQTPQGGNKHEQDSGEITFSKLSKTQKINEMKKIIQKEETSRKAKKKNYEKKWVLLH